MNRGIDNGTRYQLISLPEDVVARIMGLLDSGFSGDIIMRCHKGRILKTGALHWDPPTRPKRKDRTG